MRQTFQEHSRAYWSAQFALILEKHGWLDFREAGPEVLGQAEVLAEFAAVAVGWLPEDAWRQEYVDGLRGYKGVLLLEGPFPSGVEQWLGLSRAGGPIAGARGALAFGPEERAYVERRFGASFPIGHRSSPDASLQLSASGDPNPLRLEPRQTATRSRGFGRDAYADIQVEPFEENAGRAAVSLVLAYRARFLRNQRIFEDPLDDARALLACVRATASLSKELPLRTALASVVRDATASMDSPVPASDTRSALARAVWGLALTEASSAIEDPRLAERARAVLIDARNDRRHGRAVSSELARWRSLLAIEQAELAAVSAVDYTGIEAVAAVPTSTASAVQGWLAAEISRRLPRGPGDSPGSRSTTADLAEELTASSGRLPQRLEGLGLPDLVLILGALVLSRERPAARRLWRVLLDALYDSRQGLFMNGTSLEGGLVPAMGFATSPLVALGLLSAAGPLEITDGPMDALKRYTPEQLAAWAAPPYVLQPYEGIASDDVLLQVETSQGSFPGIWRRGSVIATSFQLLAHLIHVHTVEPVSEPFTAYRSGDAIVLEHLLMHLVTSRLAEAHPGVVNVAPWPWGIAYGMTLRHDVDRVLDAAQFDRLLSFERDEHLGVSWFWLPDRLEPAQLATLVADPRHEVGLHAVRVDQKEHELNAVNEVITNPIVGEAIHGSGDGWLGHLTVRAAVEAGLLYTELAPPVADCPYARYPWVAADGVVGADRIVGVTYNISIDGRLGTEPGSEGGPRIYRQLLNHPDLNFDRLRAWVASLPPEPRVDWTCEQTARWWRATHMAGSLRICHSAARAPGEFRFEITAQESIDNLELRLPCVPQSVFAVVVDGRAAEWQRLSVGEQRGIRIRISLRADAARAVVVHYRAGQPSTDTREQDSSDGLTATA